MIARATTALALAVLSAIPHLRAEDDPEVLARELLERAEEKARKGSYDQAVSAYEKIVEKYPNTDAGRVAERRVTPNALLGWADLVRTGPSENRVDVIVMGDGYEIDSLRSQFHSRADEVAGAFDRDETLREYMPYLNFIRAAVVSAEDGVDGYGRQYDTALDAYVTSTTATRYTAVRPRKVQEYLDQMPSHDGVAVAIVQAALSGSPSDSVATIGGNRVDPEAIVHAWGHAFARLGDEFTEPQGHPFEAGARPNVSLSETDVPWQHWIDAGHPSVGVYQGASGRATGVWRPVGGNCVMEGGRGFCPVCREAMVLSIYGVVDAIDGASPEPHDYASNSILEARLVPTATSRYEDFEFEVRTMRPASHMLEVTWWVLPDHRAPKSRGIRLPHDERKARGKLPPIDAEPAHEQRVSRDGVYTLEIDPADYEPGRYRVICRVVDTTEIRGEKYPWVLKDDAGLLESERAWWIRVP
jgi:hypothetical protein